MRRGLKVFLLFALTIVFSVSIVLAAGSIDIKANGADGPITLSSGQTLSLSWTGISVGGCSIYMGNQELSGVEYNGAFSTISQFHPFYPIKSETIYTLKCKELNSANGLSDIETSDSVTVNLASANQLSGTSTARTLTISLPATTLVKGNTYNIGWALSQPLSFYSPGIRIWVVLLDSSQNYNGLVQYVSIPPTGSSGSFQWGIPTSLASGSYVLLFRSVEGGDLSLGDVKSSSFSIRDSVVASMCTDECTPSGKTQCSGTSLQTCGRDYDSDSCLEWNTAAACPTSGQSCSNGACVTTPSITPLTIDSSGIPTEPISPTPATTQFIIKTNKAATCRYSTNLGVSYDSMTLIMTDVSSGKVGTSFASSEITPSPGQSYTYYVQCRTGTGTSAETTADKKISFSYAATGAGTGSAPIISNGRVSNGNTGWVTGNLPLGSTEASIAVDTDKDATCKWSTSSTVGYDSMTLFSQTSARYHYMSNLLPLTSLTRSSIGTYSFYVKCRDSTGNTNTNDFLVTFTVGGTGGNGPTINSFSASPTSITSGQSSTLTWSLMNSNSCTLNGARTSSGNNQIQTITVSPTQTTIYTLACTNSTGTTSKTLTVSVGGTKGIETGTCRDIDGGKSYNVKGTATGKLCSECTVPVNAEDVCTQKDSSGNYVPTSSCTGENCYIDELFCDGSGLLKEENLKCQNGCSNGACLATANSGMPTSCKDVCQDEYTCQNNICVPNVRGRIPAYYQSASDTNLNIGCYVGQTFYSLGHRTNIDYCSEELNFVRQKAVDKSCSYSFECRSDICEDNLCAEDEKPNFASRIGSWFMGLFGGDGDSGSDEPIVDESGDSESGGIAESNFNTRGCEAMKNNFDKPNGYYKCRNPSDDGSTTYRCVNPTSKTIYSQGGAFGEKYEMFCGGN